MHASAARAPRGGRERRVGLRKPVVVRRDRRPADRHSGGRPDGPIGFPTAHPSLPPGERAVRVRTETLPGGRLACGGPEACEDRSMGPCRALLTLSSLALILAAAAASPAA